MNPSLLPGDSNVVDGLDLSDTCRLMSPDGPQDTLHINLLQRHIHETTGINAVREMGQSTHSVFNSACAATDQLAAPAAEQQQPAITQDLSVSQQNVWTPTNS